MAPATLSLYCRQLVTVLQIAALFGHDPADPARVAELLVLQGRYPTTAAAAEALQAAGTPPPRGAHVGPIKGAWDAIKQVPSMIGLRVRKLRGGGAVNAAVSLAETASYVVPVLSIPAWAVGNARTVRQLGNGAVAMYSAPLPPTPQIVLPPAPGRRTRWLRTGSLLMTAVILAVLAAVIPGAHLVTQRWIALILAEAFLAVTFGRLLWITHPRHREDRLVGGS